MRQFSDRNATIAHNIIGFFNDVVAFTSRYHIGNAVVWKKIDIAGMTDKVKVFTFQIQFRTYIFEFVQVFWLIESAYHPTLSMIQPTDVIY
jgi:hypothetical protein